MNVKVLGIFTLLLALCGLMIALTPETFLLPFNIENLVRRTALFGIISIGVAFVIITGGIDLSIGSIIALTGVLLAMFLAVTYSPFDERRVLEVRSQQRTLIVAGDSGLRPGQMIRYYGGRRAGSAMLGVESARPLAYTTEDGRSVAATVIVLDGTLSADDRSGRVARVWPVAGFSPGRAAQENGPGPGGAVVTLDGDHGYLQRRDQITLLHPEAGLKQSPIASVKSAGGRTHITLAADIGSIDAAWLAVPLQRRQRMPIPAAVGAVLGITLLLGLFHGLLVTKLRLQPFVVTLCGLLFYRGVSRWMVGDQTMGFGNEYDATLRPLATGELPIAGQFGIPVPFLILIGIAVLAAVFLNRTIWGRYMMALGRNETAARYSGIHTDRVTILAYVICTVLAGVGGILFALDANSVAPSSHGNFFELYAIAAAVLGGCSLRGGEGGILGVVIGAAVMRVLYNMITLLRISTTLEFAIIGAVILLGVIADELVKRLAARRRAARARQ